MALSWFMFFSSRPPSWGRIHQGPGLLALAPQVIAAELSAVYDDEVYTPNVKDFYTINNLNEMSTYTNSNCSISKENLKSIKQLIESKIA